MEDKKMTFGVGAAAALAGLCVCYVIKFGK